MNKEPLLDDDGNLDEEKMNKMVIDVDNLENDLYADVVKSKNDENFKTLYDEYIAAIKSEDLRQLSLVAEQT